MRLDLLLIRTIHARRSSNKLNETAEGPTLCCYVYASMYLWEGSRSMYGSRPGNPIASLGQLFSTPAYKICPNIWLNCWPKCSNRWACTQTLTKQSVPAYHAKTCNGCTLKIIFNLCIPNKELAKTHFQSSFIHFQSHLWYSSKNC